MTLNKRLVVNLSVACCVIAGIGACVYNEHLFGSKERSQLNYESMFDHRIPCDSYWVLVGEGEFGGNPDQEYRFIFVPKGEKFKADAMSVEIDQTLASGSLKGAVIDHVYKQGEVQVKPGSDVRSAMSNKADLYVKVFPVRIAINDVGVEKGETYAARSCNEVWREDYVNNYASASVVSGEVTDWDVFQFED